MYNINTATLHTTITTHTILRTARSAHAIHPSILYDHFQFYENFSSTVGMILLFQNCSSLLLQNV